MEKIRGYTITPEGYIIVTVYVKPGSKYSKIEVIENGLIVHIKAKPIKGKANKEIIKLLADEIECPKSQIEIITGNTASIKRIQFRNQTKKIKALLETHNLK